MSCNHTNCKEDRNIILYILSIIIFLLTFLPISSNIRIVLYLLTIGLAGYDLILNGVINIFKLNFEENTLMSIAIIAAFIIGEYPESCIVVVLFKLGEFIEQKAIERSNRNIQDIVNIKAKTANVLVDNGSINIVEVDQVKIGNKIIIKPGEIVPLDCIILYGISDIDSSNLTGESIPFIAEEEQELLSGCINLTGSLTCEVIRDYKNSTASKIVDLVYEATNNKGKTEEFITRFSKIYTPIVIIIALLHVFVPLLIGLDFKTWLMRGLVFLVASCPCSIIISIPLAFFSCIGTISKKGMVIKGTKHIINLAKANTVAFDKTGTLTTGKLIINKIETLNGYDKQTIIQYIYSLERNSNHPISNAINKIRDDIPPIRVEKYKEIAGYGIYGLINNSETIFGNRKMLDKYNIKYSDDEIQNDAIYLVINKQLAGYVTLKEQIRKASEKIVNKLKNIGINNIVMITGDSNENAGKIAKTLNIGKIYSSLLPQQKQDKVLELKRTGKVIFVGDGINDSSVLAESDFGISMGEGSQIANNTADAVLISNKIDTIPTSITIARKSINIVNFNIFLSLILKAIVLVLGTLGLAPIWLAILADTGVTLITVINSIRIFKL